MLGAIPANSANTGGAVLSPSIHPLTSKKSLAAVDSTDPEYLHVNTDAQYHSLILLVAANLTSLGASAATY